MPASECQCQTESVYAAYLDCSLHRRYASYKGKLALTNAPICSWETICISCCGNQPPWQDDPELQEVADFLNSNHFLPQLHRGMHNVTPDEKSLASILNILVRARDGDVHIHHRDGTTSIKRARLTPTEARRWEDVLGAGLWRQAMPQDKYIPGTAFFDVPCPAPDLDAHYTCMLWGHGIDTEMELLRHVAMSHGLPSHLRT